MNDPRVDKVLGLVEQGCRDIGWDFSQMKDDFEIEDGEPLVIVDLGAALIEIDEKESCTINLMEVGARSGREVIKTIKGLSYQEAVAKFFGHAVEANMVELFPVDV